MAADVPPAPDRRCSSCGRPRAECRTPDQPFLSCCNACAADDGNTHNAARACHYCKASDRELRPYGPGGAWVCHPCATATPEREAQAEAAYFALLGSAEVISLTGVAAIGQESGPVPFDG